MGIIDRYILSAVAMGVVTVMRGSIHVINGLDVFRRPV